jgi:predicted  nucleic acid-binding Zn-ribbon protein
MDKVICPQCGVDISNQSSEMITDCPSCGANIQMPTDEKTVFSSETFSAPKTKSQLPIILITSFFTALFLLLLFAGGAYWLISQKSINVIPDNLPAGSPKDSSAQPTPRPKTRSAVSASEITKIEFLESTTSTRASAAQFFGNVNPSNFTTRTTFVSFSADGKAIKATGESGILNGVQVSPTPQEYTGAITREKFAEVAQVFVENDFLGEADSKTSTSLPVSYTLRVAYSSGEKKIQTSNSGKDTPEAAAMLRAFKNLENQVNWKIE